MVMKYLEYSVSQIVFPTRPQPAAKESVGARKAIVPSRSPKSPREAQLVYFSLQLQDVYAETLTGPFSCSAFNRALSCSFFHVLTSSSTNSAPGKRPCLRIYLRFSLKRSVTSCRFLRGWLYYFVPESLTSLYVLALECVNVWIVIRDFTSEPDLENWITYQ